ncbi:MobA/MobL family protein [Acidisoma cladoniae]|uniref:MobA/MobL family protein n=1 Tax=Acidisoma cladoniae TaxID=3040935 RepID=UPI002551154E|nr:MobA/MobL family protein [Acidisoma sp. PAMC 29798]
MSTAQLAFSRINFAMVSRSVRNGNAVKVSAYNAGTRLQHARKRFDFRHKRERIDGCILLPDGAPEGLMDPGDLWRAVEASERRHDAQLARQVLINLPRELAPEHRLDALRAVAEPWRQAGMAIQVDLHCPVASDGQEQPHGHLLLTMREVTPEGLAKTKNREWNALFRDSDGRKMRSEIDSRMNTFFAAVGLDVRVDNRSREAQGLPRELPREPIAPTAHWQQFLRDGALPEARPITIQRVFEHRAARRGWEAATAVAMAAEVEGADLGKQIAALQTENARRLAAALGTEAPRNIQQKLGRLTESKTDRADKNEEETNMAKKPQTKKPAPQSEPWMRRGGGFSGLSPRLQASAQASYAEWSKAKPELADTFSLTDYVTYVQDRHAEEREEREVAEDAPRPDEPNTIAPNSIASGDERRRTHLQALLAERYKAPSGLETWVRRIDVDKDGRRAVLHGPGGRLIDHGDRIGFEGAAFSPELASATVAAAHAYGWSSLRLTGTTAYRDAVASAAALHEPPLTTDHALSKDTAARVAEQLRQRATQSVPSLPDLAGLPHEEVAALRIARERALAQATMAGEPKGVRDQRAISSPQIAELVSRRNQAKEDASESTTAADAHRAAHSWSARLLDGSVRRRQAALDAEAARQDAEARSLDRGHERNVRRIEKTAKREALANTRAHEDWVWSPEVRKANAKLGQLDALSAAVAAGNPAVTEAVAAGDWKQGHQALKASTAEQEAMRLASLTPAQQRDAALRRLAENEHSVGEDPKKLAEARSITAAAIAGDPDTVAAAAGGDMEGATQAAETFRKRQAAEEAERRRERDLLLDAQMRREAAMAQGFTGPG